MDEQQILEQLNELEDEVKPREKWVNMTKSELFENAQQQKAAATLISKAFTPLQRPALALTGLGLLVMVLSGGMIYSPQLVKIDEPMPTVNNDKLLAQQQQEEMAASLESLQKNLNKINKNLAEVKKSDGIKALGKLATIRTTAEGLQRTAQSMATTTEDPQTLAALVKIQESSKEALQTSQKDLSKSLENFLDYLNNNKEDLTEKDRERLENAREAFGEDKYDKAIMLVNNMEVLSNIEIQE